MTEVQNIQTCKECGNNKIGTYCDVCKKETSTNYFTTVTDTVTLSEYLKGKIKSKDGGRARVEFTSKSMPSGNKKYPKGVHQHITVDRKEGTYDQVVTDLHTGEIAHEEHTALSEHFSKHTKNKQNSS